MADSVNEKKRMGVSGILLRIADGIDGVVGRICRLVIFVVGTFVLLVLSSNVVARYALETGGFRYAQELPERLFPFLIMAGAVLAVQRGGHLAVEMLPSLLPREGRRVLALLGFSIVIAAYSILGWQALMIANISWIDLSPILHMPASYGYYALSLGCVGVVLSTGSIALRVAISGPEAIPASEPEEQPT